MFKISLEIAGVIIQIQSKYKGELSAKDDGWRLNNFLYKGSKRAHISLNVKIVKELPRLLKAKRIFVSIHPDLDGANWALFKGNGRYILKNYLEGKKQHIELNNAFDKGKAYLLPDKEGRLRWKVMDIIYDALQVILMNYLSTRHGIFMHSMGVKDIDKAGIIFIGKSGSGKSTLARLWNKHSRAMVLNDDRIIIRKIKGDFFIYGSPWHGDFSDYLISKIDSAKLSNILFIHKRQENSLRPVSEKEAFRLLYPNLFPTFWDKRGLRNALDFCNDLIQNLSCYRLGFRKDKGVIGFARTMRKYLLQRKEI